MREIEIKVWPIRIGEQAREMEVERRMVGRSVPHIYKGTIAGRTCSSGEARERERKKRTKIYKIKNQPRANLGKG